MERPTANDGSSKEHVLLGERDAQVRAVGRALIDHGLGRGVSLFDPARPVWSAKTVDELYRCYNERPDTGADAFLVKLRRQLDDASDDAILLMAELLTLHSLPLHNFKPVNKRARVTEVLGWMREPVALRAAVDEALEQSSWNGGQGAHTMIWKWLADAVTLIQTWWRIEQPKRARALADPWDWEETIHRIPAMPSLREELLYLAFPEYFLPIVSLKHKNAIRQAFAHRLNQPTGNLDRDLFQIVVSLQREAGGPVELYDPPYIDDWQPQVLKQAEQRAWLLRPRPAGQSVVDRWKSGGYVSVAAQHLDELPPHPDFAEVRLAVEHGYQHLEYAQRVALASEFHAFLSGIAVGDIVATIVADQVSVGEITGDPAFMDTAGGGHLQRPVTWVNSPSTAIAELPGAVAAEFDHAGTVVNLTGALDALKELSGQSSAQPDDPGPEEPEEPATLIPALPPVTPELASRLCMSESWPRELSDLLQERRQVVLYGPPGTGKTFIAQEIARHIADREAVQLVQFHPSYAYEDFFEGFRPAEADDRGAVGFKLTPGPLRQIAATARANPGSPYVLILDEINRANLAKVFGELYFLLEYRNSSIRLQYSPNQSFTLPPNLLIIGTMNTADRSIAVVDAAIRRRFAFMELQPDDLPVRDVLRTWLDQRHLAGDERADLLLALNDEIGVRDRDFKIGPSYLMRPGADTASGLERVWRYDLLPLLEEHYYGRLTRAEIEARFGLKATRQRAQAVPDDPPGLPDAPVTPSES